MSGARVVALRVLQPLLPLRLTFAHHLAARRESRPQLVELRLADGTRGWGEAQPRPYVTGESEASVRAALEGSLGSWLRGQELPDLPAAAALLAGPQAAAWREAAPAAFAALELAALDAAGKRCGRSAVETLGGARRSEWPSAGAVIGLLPPTAAAWFAARVRALGKRWVKVKVGDAHDSERVAAVRRVLGPEVELLLDANAAWTRAQAVERLAELRTWAPASVEQPVAREDRAGLAHVARASGLRVVADESLCTLADARTLLALAPEVHWNLRVGKCGGLLATLALWRLAREHGLDCQLGVLVGETGLLGAAGRLCAAALPELSRVEDDGGLLLAADVVREAPRSQRAGFVRAPSGPGLGVEVDEQALAAACRAPYDPAAELRTPAAAHA